MNSDSWNIFWDEAMKQIRAELSEQEFSMWFNRMEYSYSRDSEIVVTVPSSFYRDQVRQRYLRIIEQKLHELSGTDLALDFEVKTMPRGGDGSSSVSNGNGVSAGSSDSELTRNADGEDGHPARGGDGSEAGATAASARTGTAAGVMTTPAKKSPHPNLREEYTFENFVIGQNNSFAANAGMAIARNPGTGYNPCLIYGGVGLGKTHLIQSIGNYAHQEFDNLKILYVTMESFTNDFIQSLRENRTQSFKNRYRYADILLVDDIHFLQNKPETQEELFHTFNALYDSNKQMVFTSDRPVSDIRDLTDRLRSRFERGLNVDLQPPSYETRYAILKKKIDHTGIRIPEEVTELICNNVTTNVRDLESALTKLVAYADLVDKEISPDVARQQLKDFFASPKQTNITMDVIQRTVADYFNLSSQELKGKKRTKVIAFPRQLAMYIAREITEYSTTEVGLEFGGRDHTTVMHACQRIEHRMRTDPTVEPTVQFLVRQIKEQGTKSR
ncbi:MAG: chromosomal replication initiator protein DnaA [Spirochaetes bacterium]|jgi:chromosomal replication initiator protein|nr:chromosomal replication initiator protein DnaA [Spirochaetota bacterium]